MVMLKVSKMLKVPGDTLIALDLSGWELPDVDLAERNCSGTNFSGANMRNADFSAATLEECRFVGTNLSGAEIGYHVCAHKANFQSADLRKTNFSDADLTYASFIGADLEKANLRGATLTGALFDLEHMPDAWKDLPTVLDLPERIEAALSEIENSLVMCEWHTCRTAHCLAGWAVYLTLGEHSFAEATYGTPLIGAGLFFKAIGIIPDFYCEDDEALRWLTNFTKSRQEARTVGHSSESPKS